MKGKIRMNRKTNGKTVFRLIAAALALAGVALLCSPVLFRASAEQDGEASIDDKALVTYGFLRSFREELKEELKQELLDEIGGGGSGGETGSEYEEVFLECGDVLAVGAETELIFRGGGALVLSTADGEGKGLSDLSVGEELYSGDPLSFGHIYYQTETESTVFVLVTGTKAAFTIRGSYAKN